MPDPGSSAPEFVQRPGFEPFKISSTNKGPAREKGIMPTIGELKKRIKAKVEDSAGDIYSDVAIDLALNEAKDEVLSMINIFSDEMFQTSASYTFDAGAREVNLSTDSGAPGGIDWFCGILRVESQPDGYDEPRAHILEDFRRQDEFVDTVDFPSLYLRWEDSKNVFLGRKDTDKALTVLVYYSPWESDSNYATPNNETISWVFGPPAALNLVVTKSTLSLLASRNRRNRRFEVQENKQEVILEQLLQRLNRANARYVDLVE